MEPRGGINKGELTALLIAPDRALADQITASQSRARAFQILADLKTYPTRHTLDIRLRQLRPDVVLIDLGSDLAIAGELVRYVAMAANSIQVVGLHPVNDPDVLLTCLRMGASEFLSAPFDGAIQQEAVSRLVRLREPDELAAANPGSVVVFSSTKPGSGASTLATHTAFSIHRRTGKKVLLADFDLIGGTIGFYSRITHTQSVLDAMQSFDVLNASFWSTLISEVDGIDVLPAPETPYAGRVDASRLNAVIEYARYRYDCVVIDLPVIFQPLSLMVLSNADRALLISTAELPSMHLARKAVHMLNQLGFPKDRFQILLNRVNRKDDISKSDMEKLFGCPVHSKFPNDYFSLHRVVTLGQSLQSDCELGAAVDGLAAELSSLSHPRQTTGLMSQMQAK